MTLLFGALAVIYRNMVFGLLVIIALLIGILITLIVIKRINRRF